MLSRVRNLRPGLRVGAGLVAASAAAVAGGVTAFQPVLAGGVAATAFVAWCLSLAPSILLAVALHKGIWNEAPVIVMVGQELPTIGLIGLTAILIALRQAGRTMPTTLVGVGVVTTILLVYEGVGAVVGGGLGATEKSLRVVLFTAWGFLLAWLIGVDRRATILALTFTVVGAVVIAIASLPGWVNTGTPTVFGENRILYGRSVGVGAVIALGAALTGRLNVTWRTVSGAVGIALAAVTVVSTSRGAFVSLGAAGLAMIALPLAGRGIRYRAFAFAVLCGIGIVSVAAVSGSVGFDRLLSLTNPGDDVTAVMRTQAIDFAYHQWLGSPLFGVGLRDLNLTVSFAGVTQVLPYPHNMLMEVLSQTGVVGLALTMAVIAWPPLTMLRNGLLRADPIVTLLIGGLVFYLVSAQFSGDLQINRYVWTLAYLVAAVPAWQGTGPSGPNLR